MGKNGRSCGQIEISGGRDRSGSETTSVHHRWVEVTCGERRQPGWGKTNICILSANPLDVESLFN
jgi:hypothetical protein